MKNTEESLWDWDSIKKPNVRKIRGFQKEERGIWGRKFI